ncbi:cache domain-containing protein [uncultured Cocleimonas sp.]|uniref:cache domain-containing protein n=1 Tax=uncultured Cocleimonas sp. TaxID=1051587 RepID=UPI002616CC39|nr:cache domain-containing protein [uncultured Cocleimonas sp.]
MFVLLIPFGFSISSLYQNSWSQAQQSMLEKHQLISQALIEPFTLFISSRQKSLAALGKDIITAKSQQRPYFVNKQKQKERYEHDITRLINKYYNSYEDLVSISYISADKETKLISSTTLNKSETDFPLYSDLPLTSLNTGKKSYRGNFISPVFISRFNNKPVVLLKRHLIREDNETLDTIRAEVSLNYIDTMCSKINFGHKGHCATVDQTGHVISHPNKEWMREIRDLSKLLVVKKMMAGLSGTTEFYSPFIKEDMVAGYSAIPGLGWGGNDSST